jgi:hypothetical protein
VARGDSTIRVAIIGDAKGLKQELGEAEKGIKGFSVNAKALVGAIGATIVADQLVSFGKTALAEADRLGDATKRLELQLGGLSDQLVESSDDFAHLGQSSQDVLELEAAFADVATSLGVADPLIAGFADEAAATAAAVALMGDQDAASVIDLIGKAAGGSQKALKALGINLSDAEIEARALSATGKTNAAELTKAEKSAAAYALVLEKLQPKLVAVTEAGGDFESKTAEIDAKLETLTAKIGGHLEGPLNDLLDWIIRGIEGWEMLGDRIDEIPQLLRDMLGPLGDVIDLWRDFVGLTDEAGVQGSPFTLGRPPAPPTPHQVAPVAGSGNGAFVTINVPPTGAQTEAAVVRALREYEARNGPLS